MECNYWNELKLSKYFTLKGKLPAGCGEVSGSGQLQFLMVSSSETLSSAVV